MKKIINDNVHLDLLHLDKLPDLSDVDILHGTFFCNNNYLTSLHGCPSTIMGSLLCTRNNLTSLKGAARYVGSNFSVSLNPLTSLEGCPLEVRGDFFCQLTAVKFTEEQIRSICKISGRVYV